MVYMALFKRGGTVANVLSQQGRVANLKDRRATRKERKARSKSSIKGDKFNRFMDFYKQRSLNKQAKWEYKAKTAKAREAGKTLRSGVRSGVAGVATAGVSNQTNDGLSNISGLLKQEYVDNTVSTGSTGTAKKSTKDEDYDTSIGNGV